MSDEITTSEAAKILGVTSRTVRNWASEGKLPCTYTEGGHRRFSAAEVQSFLEQKSTHTVPDGIQF